MDHEFLKKTAQELAKGPKGILAADESDNTCNKRFEAVGVDKTEENRRIFRQLLFTTPNIEDYVNGVILYDETFYQESDKGVLLRKLLESKNIMPGIKVDMGLVDLPGFPNEQTTQGLDTLPERIEKYAREGARFAKWRAVINISEGTPTDEAIGSNTYALARYSRICQEFNVVPIVEPEVLFDGTHTIERCEQVTRHVYDILFQTMRAFRVDLEGAILKTGMVLPGKQSENEINPSEVAGRTASALRENVPHELGGVVFLSGGQTPEQAMVNLNEIAKQGAYPWGLTFSYSRALQEPVLKHWANNPEDVEGAQMIFSQQLNQVSQAQQGILGDLELPKKKALTPSRSNMTKVISIGSITRDVFLEGDIFEPKCEDGECFEHLRLGDKLYADRATFSTGGNASNASVTFAKQGLDSYFMGAFGSDPSGNAAMDDMSSNGVKLDLSTQIEGMKSSYSVVLLAPKGDRTILRVRAENEDQSKVDEKLNLIDADWLYLSSLGSMERLEKVIEIAKQKNIKIAFNPGTLELENPDKLKELLPNISILSLNKEETQILFDGESMEELALNAAQVVEISVVTDGPRGEAASDGTQVCVGGMYEDVPVLDRTGAGDAFGSGFTSAIIQGKSLSEAITLGSANSTSVVQKIGAKPGILSKDDQIHEMPIECKGIS